MVGVFKQIAGLVQAALGDVLADGHIVFAGKEMGKIELVNIAGRGYILQLQRLAEVLVNVFQRRSVAGVALDYCLIGGAV